MFVANQFSSINNMCFINFHNDHCVLDKFTNPFVVFLTTKKTTVATLQQCGKPIKL